MMFYLISKNDFNIILFLPKVDYLINLFQFTNYH